MVSASIDQQMNIFLRIRNAFPGTSAQVTIPSSMVRKTMSRINDSDDTALRFAFNHIVPGNLAKGVRTLDQNRTRKGTISFSCITGELPVPPPLNMRQKVPTPQPSPRIPPAPQPRPQPPKHRVVTPSPTPPILPANPGVKGPIDFGHVPRVPLKPAPRAKVIPPVFTKIPSDPDSNTVKRAVESNLTKLMRFMDKYRGKLDLTVVDRHLTTLRAALSGKVKTLANYKTAYLALEKAFAATKNLRVDVHAQRDRQIKQKQRQAHKSAAAQLKTKIRKAHLREAVRSYLLSAVDQGKSLRRIEDELKYKTITTAQRTHMVNRKLVPNINTDKELYRQLKQVYLRMAKRMGVTSTDNIAFAATLTALIKVDHKGHLDSIKFIKGPRAYLYNYELCEQITLVLNRYMFPETQRSKTFQLPLHFSP